MIARSQPSIWQDLMGARTEKAGQRCRKGKCHQERLSCDRKRARQHCKTFIYFGFWCFVCVHVVSVHVCMYISIRVCMCIWRPKIDAGSLSLSPTPALFLYHLQPSTLRQTLPELRTHRWARLVSHLTLGIPVSASGEMGL